MSSAYSPHPLIVPVIVRDDYLFALEHNYDTAARGWALFIHCHVAGGMTPTKYRAMKRDFATLKGLINQPINALHDPGDAVHAHFLRAAGFLPTGDQWTDQSGQPRERYISPP